MTRVVLLSIVTLSMLSVEAFAQSPIAVKYCRDLAATYRKAVSDGKAVVEGAGQAAANCPTNPPDSIAVLEAALKELKVDLPPK